MGSVVRAGLRGRVSTVGHRQDLSRPEPGAALHPSAARLLLALGPEAIRLDPSYLRAWILRSAPTMNAALAEGLGPRLRLVELFAGIGGLGSGLERALDAVTILQAEAEAPRLRILARRFPLAYQLPDVREVPDLPCPDDPDRLIVAGGFPCRGASRANLTGARGMAHHATGLWGVMAEVVRRWAPRAVIWENVTVLRSRGLDQVLADLAGAGYDVLWGVLKAADFGAPHERARLFGIARRRGAASMTIIPRPSRTEWTPWDSPIPGNDADAPGQSARVAALGDAVVPIVAWAVGHTAARVLGGWWPSGGRRHTGGPPSMNGALTCDGIVELSASRFEVLRPQRTHRWVTVDERNEDPRACGYSTAPPVVGRVYYENGDNVDVELPGGDIWPFPTEWLKNLWPTPTANDGRNRGARAQWRRRSPGINVLAQADRYPREEWAVEEALVDLFAGQGVGPGFVEWLMGFPAGWTGGMIPDSPRPANEARVGGP